MTDDRDLYVDLAAWKAPSSMWSDRTTEGAAQLCAVVLSRKSASGRFVMRSAQARRAMKLRPSELNRLVKQGMALDWMVIWSDLIELKAAGIHVAKIFLSSPH